MFAAFLPGQGTEIARGGRYDDIGGVFGNARPATGFSADLLNLYQLAGGGAASAPGILAPDDDDPALQRAIGELRAGGERVVVDLSRGRSSAADQHCDRRLVADGDAWRVTGV